MKALDHQRKSLVLILLKGNTKFCLSLHYNADNIYLFVNGKETFKFKADNKNVNFPTQFCLGSIPNGFSNTESREVCDVDIIFQSITILLTYQTLTST